jgi:hypothetical protein
MPILRVLLSVLIVLAASAWSQAQPTTRPVPNVFAWAPAGDVGIAQAVWCMGFGWVDQGVPDTVADELLKRPAGNRALLILRAVNNLPAQPADFLAFGLDDYAGRKYYGSLFRRLAARGAKPDFVATDEEWGYSNWALFAQPDDAEALKVAREIYADPLITAAMPRQLAALTPDSLRAPGWWSVNNPPVLAWNNWTTQLRFNALDRLIYAQAQAVWPSFDDYGNYGDIGFKFAVQDLNGWAATNLHGASVSCPALYLNCGQAVAPARGFKKHPLWNNLIRTINLARSCAAAGPTRAWVSYPSYSGDGGRQYSIEIMRAIWTQQIRHVAASNVSFIYWNPVTGDKPAEDDAYAARVFLSNPVRRAIRPAELVPIPFDADVIRTGDVVTRYADLEPMLRGDSK